MPIFISYNYVWIRNGSVHKNGTETIMSKILQDLTATAALGSIHVTPDTLRQDTMKQTDTSKKIRFLLAQGKTRGQVEKLLFEYGVRTKEGNPIRYQFINNVMNQRIK